jgi:hypothetical protein
VNLTPLWFRILLAAQALWEMFRYDLLVKVSGFRAVHARSGKPRPVRRSVPDLETLVPKVVLGATAFYWKPVLCLQRSVVAARVLRKHGVAAEVVIGCRPIPYAGHAWVEVDGRPVNDTRGYQQKMLVLERF